MKKPSGESGRLQDNTCPALVEAFLRCEKEFRNITEALAD